jgi:16S rRNA (adenine1518-N6/adenine1519-N6)-dimethyltransferase
VTLTLTQVRALLAAHGVRPTKALGQHFLADPNTAERIVRLAGVGVGDHVVEVGPGVGSLTVALLDAGARVVAVELDRRVVPVLEEVTAGRDITIVVADAAHIDWDELLGDRALVMVQREVGERLAARPGDDAYGAVSVKIAYYGDARVVGRVPRRVFVPEPNVDSVLVRWTRHDAPPVDVDATRMFALVRAGFATRRKTLRRALDGLVAADEFERAGIDPRTRAETLSLADWARLTSAR